VDLVTIGTLKTNTHRRIDATTPLVRHGGSASPG
jgi:hypothetical protein